MKHPSRAFTIIELLVVVSIIALLIGILLPAIGKAREQAKLTQSQANMRNLAAAHATYSGEWNDRQITFCDDNLSRYGSNEQNAYTTYNSQNGMDHPPMILGWSGGGLWGYWMDWPVKPRLRTGTTRKPSGLLRKSDRYITVAIV